MDAEVVKSEVGQVSVESGNVESSSLLDHKENVTLHEGTGTNESIKFGSHVTDELVDKEGTKAPEVNFPKDVVDEWPAPKQIHSFYFVKYRSYEDPKLKAKLDLADRDIQKKTQARSQILDKLKEKRAERAKLIAQMRPLNDENKQFWSIVDEKRKEMEPLQQALGKLRSTNNVNREKGVYLCSSEEELNGIIKSFQYRIQHESIPLSEEKQLLREIKQLEGTREKVIANAAMRTKIQDSLAEKEAIQDQVKLMGADLDGVRKEQQVVKAKLNQLGDEKKVIDKEIESLEADLTAITEKREKAYETLQELRKQRDEGNACFYQNRSMLNKAREIAAKKDVEALREMSNNEVEKFMSIWNTSKAVRDDYERRILPSLDIRQLSRDGRMRNLDEKPLVLPETSTSPETEAVTKTNVKEPKVDTNSSSQHDTVPVEKVLKETKNKPQKESKNKPTDSEATLETIDKDDVDRVSGSEKPQKVLQPKKKEIDEAKLKEMKREEEMEKARQALERKKKLAEKAAAKAAIKAQKEAEKKLKEREKKARKKAAASTPAPEPEELSTEADINVTEPEKVEESIEAPVLTKNKDRKENSVRYRNRPRGSDSVPKVLLKRKKSTNYWLWAASAAATATLSVLIVVGYKYLF
ncbi:hypothetical protein NMG60_11003416 [Bertholletia excelsa]